MLKCICPYCNKYYDGELRSSCPYCDGKSQAAPPSKSEEVSIQKTEERKQRRSFFAGFSKKSHSQQPEAPATENKPDKPSTTFQGDVPADGGVSNGFTAQGRNSTAGRTGEAAVGDTGYVKTTKISDIPVSGGNDIYSSSGAMGRAEIEQGGEYYTEPVSRTAPSCEEVNPGSLRAEIDSSVDIDKTFGVMRTESDSSPVVGWLVCLNGVYQGESFEIHQGKNHIGRAMNMSVVLSKERTVSRDKHATVIFDPVSNKFYIVSGESNALTYLNGKLLLRDDELKAKDIITLGSCELIFIPLCDGTFDWNNYIK